MKYLCSNPGQNLDVKKTGKQTETSTPHSTKPLFWACRFKSLKAFGQGSGKCHCNPVSNEGQGNRLAMFSGFNEFYFDKGLLDTGAKLNDTFNNPLFACVNVICDASLY